MENGGEHSIQILTDIDLLFKNSIFNLNHKILPQGCLSIKGSEFYLLRTHVMFSFSP